MADSENTAVNDLIARVSGPTRVDGGSEPDMGVATIPVAPRPRTPSAGHTAIPASMPVAAPFEPPARPAGLPTSYPVAARGVPAPAPPADGAWRARRVFGNGEHLVGTIQLSRRSDTRAVIKKLVLPMALLVLAGVLIGAYIASGGRTQVAAPVSHPTAPVAAPRAPAPAAVAAAPVAPAPAAPTPVAAPPPVAEAAPIASAPALVDVRIDSTPPGATVTMIDRGRPLHVGTTPIAAAIDPSREYDLVLALAGRPDRTVHLDARTTHRIAIAFEPPATAVAAPAPPPARRAEPRRAEPAGAGTLMISSKPPCEIAIDGKPTGLTTPQRAIALAAGRHKVTLINREKAIEKTLTVQITADQTEKVIEDLMK